MIRSILFFVSAFFTITCWSQRWEKTPSGIKATIDSVRVEASFYTPSTVRIIKHLTSGPFVKQSLSVIKNPDEVPVSYKQQKDAVILRSSSITIELNLKTAALRFLTGTGEGLLSETGSAIFTPFDDAGNKTFSVEQDFKLATDEAIYGLGQQQQGRMSQRNVRLNMVQNNTEDFIPFFQSVKGYGLFWDNYSPTLFTDQPGKTSFRSEVGDGIDYYFMYGGNSDGVIACMRELTGRAPMFPLWTFGFFQSKERYKSQEEAIDVVRKYRELKVPLDGIIQDWQYWGNNYLWNAMEFLNPEFPDGKKFVDDVHKLNAHLTISIWNSFGPQTKQYRELDSIGALMNFTTWPQSGSEKWPPNRDYPSGVKVYDAYHPVARDIFWKYLKNGLYDLDIDGWWLDSSEPDHLDKKPSDFDNNTFLGSFRKVRNAYPLMTVGGIYDHQRKLSHKKRVFILTRSAFAGQQRYGANTWSGDVNSSWTALRNQVAAGLNFSLTGIPYWNSDIGGFFLWNFKKKLTDPDYRELYVRWLQFGTFCPMMRSHGADAPREIYQFGKRGEKAYDAIEKFIRLRYELLPYIYSTSWDVTRNHSTMMRALFMDFVSDKKVHDINDQFMFGKSILVHPVTTPMYTRPVINDRDTTLVEDHTVVRITTTYLPKGSDWYDFWSGDKFAGGSNHTKETPLDIIPVFVKAGSMIPFGPDVQYATEKKWDSLHIRIYPGADGEFTLYEDENDNYNYETGVYSTIVFSWNDKKRILTIDERAGSFPGMLQKRYFKFDFPGRNKNSSELFNSETTKLVEYTGQKKEIHF